MTRENVVVVGTAPLHLITECTGYTECHCVIADSTTNTPPPKSTKSINPNSPVQIQIKPESQFEFVSQDTDKSGCVDWVDLRGVACVAVGVTTVILNLLCKITV